MWRYCSSCDLAISDQLWSLVGMGVKMLAWGDGQEGREDLTDKAVLLPHSPYLQEQSALLLPFLRA